MHRLHKVRSTTWLLLSGLVSLCLISALLFAITVVAVLSANRQNEMRQIETQMRVAWQVLHELGPDVSVVDGRMFAGSALLNGNTEFVDHVRNLVGGAATVFLYDVCVTTNVLMPDGRRAIGIPLHSPIVREALLVRHEPFRGKVDVLDRQYYAEYDPIFDRTGAFVGILYVGNPASQDLAGLDRRTTLLLGLPAAGIVLVGVMLYLVGCKLNAQITARQQSLEATHAQLDTALANMANGLALWSGDERLVLFNARIHEILDTPPGQIRRGMTFREFIAIRHAAGAYGHIDFEACYRQRAELVKRRESRATIDTGRSGRVISVLHRPMADGGWVGTFEDVTERHAANARISFMAHYDALTGLGNRVLFDQRLGEMLEEATRSGDQVAVLGLDLDRFKPVNDMLGHAAGDKLLAAVAKRLASVVRASDLVARLGGDEFAIVVPLADDGPLAHQALADRIVEDLSAPFTIDDQPVVIGVSIGIALFPHDGSVGNELLRCADIAMYRAKEEGRNTFRVFEAAMDKDLRERRALERDLRTAVDDEALELYYQPLVCCGTQLVQGYEALLRWNHPVRGSVPPSVFVPLAEETGLILKLGQWVLETACRTAASWVEPVRVAVNLSPVQFRHHELAPMVLGAVARSGLDPARLEIEITEGVLMDDPARAVEVLTVLRAAGIRISLDDFGTGYSSLSYLRQFPLDKIKIDKSFIDEMDSDPQAASIVDALVSLAHTLNLSVTAEGVETPEQLRALRGQMCDQVQGYLLGRPAPDTPQDTDSARQGVAVLVD